MKGIILIGLELLIIILEFKLEEGCENIAMMFNKLFEIDKVSDSIGNINFREAVRGIIIKENKILMVHSKNQDYKFPGGGIKKDEGHIEA